MCKECVSGALCPTHALKPENEIMACPGHWYIHLCNTNHTIMGATGAGKKVCYQWATSTVV